MIELKPSKKSTLSEHGSIEPRDRQVSPAGRGIDFSIDTVQCGAVLQCAPPFLLCCSHVSFGFREWQVKESFQEAMLGTSPRGNEGLPDRDEKGFKTQAAPLHASLHIHMSTP